MRLEDFECGEDIDLMRNGHGGKFIRIYRFLLRHLLKDSTDSDEVP